MADEKLELSQHGGGSGHGASRSSHGHGAHGGGGHEEHEGAPEWLISFADNVVLQMGFFVILFALAMKAPKGTTPAAGQGSGTPQSGPTAEQLDWAIAVREAFNNPVDPTSTDPNDYLLIQRLAARNGAARASMSGPLGEEHDVRSLRPSEYYGLGGVVPFEQEAAELGEAGRAALAELVEHLRGHRNVLEIRGHVSAPEAFGKPDRGMTLSYQRARAVADALAAAGFDWQQLRLLACGDNDRVVRDRYDAEGHRANQRVEVIVQDRAPADSNQP
jgi:outer membrane protein OmpA-like peptidoglycan-associated protein